MWWAVGLATLQNTLWNFIRRGSSQTKGTGITHRARTTCRQSWKWKMWFPIWRGYENERKEARPHREGPKKRKRCPQLCYRYRLPSCYKNCHPLLHLSIYTRWAIDQIRIFNPRYMYTWHLHIHLSLLIFVKLFNHSCRRRRRLCLFK